MLHGETEKGLVGFYINFIHVLFCSAGARSLVGAFPCQCCFLVCGGRVFGNHLLWVLAAACAGPAGAGGVRALRRPMPEGQAWERAECSTAPASLRQSAAKVWPLCGFGGRVPAGASGWQEKWAVNKAGPRQVPPAQHVPDPCAARRLLQLMAVGAWAWESLRGHSRCLWGLSPLRCSCSLGVGHPPHRLGALREALHPWGDAGGDWSRAALLSCLPSRQPEFRLGVQRMAAAMGLSRAVVAGEWESKHLCAGLGAAASNGFDGAVVVCCLENLHSAPCPRGPRHHRPWRYLNITASRRGVR